MYKYTTNNKFNVTELKVLYADETQISINLLEFVKSKHSVTFVLTFSFFFVSI